MIKLQYSPIKIIVADIFIKSLNKLKHEHCMKMLGFEEIPQFYQQINNRFKKEIHNLENVEHVNHYATYNIDLRESDETLIHVGKK